LHFEIISPIITHLMKNTYLFGIFATIFLGFAVNASATVSLTDGQSTCPDSNGWTKVDSNDLSLYPVSDATAYCFKAGSDASQGCEGGLFETWPQTEGTCGLSHWSYFIPSETGSPTPTPTEDSSPTPTPTGESDPTPTPTPSDGPKSTPTPRPTPAPKDAGEVDYPKNSDPGSVLGASTGQVLGASTFAATGSSTENLGMLLMILGLTSAYVSAKAYQKAK